MSDRIVHISPEELAAQMKMCDEFREIKDRPQTYHIVTFGCQMNAHDSEKLAGMLDRMGMTYCEDREAADFVLFNTCCVRDNAERKALGNATWLKEIKKNRRYDSGDLRLYGTGTWNGGKTAEELPVY